MGRRVPRRTSLSRHAPRASDKWGVEGCRCGLGFYGSLLLALRYPPGNQQETSRSPRFTWTVSDSAPRKGTNKRQKKKIERRRGSISCWESLSCLVFFLFFLFDFLLYSILLYSALFCSVLFHSIPLTLFYSKARHVRGGCMVLWRTREIILQYTAPPSPSFCCVGQCGGLLAVFFRARARALLGRLVTASVIFTY